MKEITNFSNVITLAIKNNILTHDAMVNSFLFTEYWLACRDLAKAIVRANYSKTEKARKLKAWDFDDLVSEFSILLERKFETQVNAILNPSVDENGNFKKHNFNAYNTTMLANFLKNKIDKFAIKVTEEYVDENNKKHRRTVNAKVVDNNGVAHNIYWDVDSISRSISDDDNLTLGDTLTSDTYQPETTSIANADEIAARKESFEHLRKMCKMKSYLGCIYVYIEDKLIENCIPCSLKSILEIFNNIESKSHAFQIAAQKAFVRAYNNDLVNFVDFTSESEISDEAVDFILTNYGKAFSDFGRGFQLNEDTIYHRRDEYKKALAKIIGIEVPKKYKKRLEH